jgi:hypothetical protein
LVKKINKINIRTFKGSKIALIMITRRSGGRHKTSQKESTSTLGLRKQRMPPRRVTVQITLSSRVYRLTDLEGATAT